MSNELEFLEKALEWADNNPQIIENIESLILARMIYGSNMADITLDDPLSTFYVEELLKHAGYTFTFGLYYGVQLISVNLE